MDRLERTIACKDEKGRHYTVHVLRKHESWTGSWTGISSGPQTLDRLPRFILAENPRRDITPVTGVDSVDTFEILDDGTIIEALEQT